MTNLEEVLTERTGGEEVLRMSVKFFPVRHEHERQGRDGRHEGAQNVVRNCVGSPDVLSRHFFGQIETFDRFQFIDYVIY